AGKPPRAIARGLNAEKIAGPRGRPWSDTTIRGHALRGTGILRNELYVGRLVWNRQRYVKDPRTGKRLARLNPPSAWLVTDVPELRILDDDLWHLAHCGICGGPLAAVGKDYLTCSAAHRQGTCSNKRSIRRPMLEGLILDGLKDRLMAPELVKEFVAE